MVGHSGKSLYSTKEWKAFRQKLILQFGAYCAKCEASGPGVVLQVHHLKYRRGKKPWEHELSDLEILCRGCHAEVHGHIPPRTGWEFEGFNDTGEPSEECERCDTEIRYVYTISHPDWGVLDVGEQCCDRLTAEIDATGHLRLYKSAARRKATFLKSPMWRSIGGVTSRRYQGFYCEIIPADSAFRLRLSLPGRGAVSGRERFATERDARACLFDRMEAGDVHRYFAKRFPGAFA